jgi:hypothetical protein
MYEINKLFLSKIYQKNQIFSIKMQELPFFWGIKQMSKKIKGGHSCEQIGTCKGVS